MSRYWSDHVAALSPYVPGEQPRQQALLKLNTNEHPHGPSPKALAVLRQAIGDDLRLYPDPEAKALCAGLAEHHGLTPEQVFVGNGSDEVLAHVFNALFRRQGRPLLVPDITYSFYRTYCQLFDVPAQLIPLADDFSLQAADYIALGGTPVAGVIFANPNAPTGISLPLDDVRAIAEAHRDVPVAVDEAYVDFGGESAVALLDAHPNVVVVRTFSKSRALAGLRIGYVLAHPDIVDGLRRVKDSFNSYPLDRLAQAAALASVEDQAYFEQGCQAVIQTRTRLSAQLSALGFHVLPSSANFVFASHPAHEGEALSRALREQGVLVRHFSQPRISRYLRITVGTSADCDRLIEVLTRILRA